MLIAIFNCKIDYHEKLKKAIYEYFKIIINEINNLQNEIEILKVNIWNLTII